MKSICTFVLMALLTIITSGNSFAGTNVFLDDARELRYSLTLKPGEERIYFSTDSSIMIPNPKNGLRVWAFYPESSQGQWSTRDYDPNGVDDQPYGDLSFHE